MVDCLANKVRKRQSPDIIQTHGSFADIFPRVTEIREFRMMVRVLHELLHI